MLPAKCFYTRKLVEIDCNVYGCSVRRCEIRMFPWGNVQLALNAGSIG